MDYKALSPAQLVLVCLRADDEYAWVEFVERFQPLIASVVMRVSRRWGETSHEILDDLIQETYLKLCANRTALLQRFQTADLHSIFGFVKVFTANLAHDHFKTAHSRKRGGGVKIEPADEQTLPSPGAHSSNLAVIERSILLGQIDACLREGDSGEKALRDRRIFWLYYRVGLAASTIAAAPGMGLTTKGVESVILRMTRMVRQKLAAVASCSSEKARSAKGIQAAESL